MMPDGISIKIDDLTQQMLCARTKYEVVERLADAYTNTSEYKAMLGSIRIDLQEIKERVMDRIVDEIIKNWKES